MHVSLPLRDHRPGAHDRQNAAPMGDADLRPSGHSKQWWDPALAAYVPGPQRAQSTPPPLLKLPGPQSKHAVAPDVLLAYLPGPQRRHPIERAVPVCHPAGHAVHETTPAPLMKPAYHETSKQYAG